jgi:hypothetical protein
MIGKFQIFGSENSTDYDVMVFVDEILDVESSHRLCKEHDLELAKILTDKPLNSNLAIIKDGFVVDVFKGVVSEVNNALFYTYDLHKQHFPLLVKEPVIREYDVKIIRVHRSILSFFSRTKLRTVIKSALRGDLREKLPVLSMIDFCSMREFPGKKESVKDIYKVIAFQYGQLFSLVDGFEKDSYTKNGIIKSYPDLEPFLNRKDLSEIDYGVLNKYKERLIELTDERIDKMLQLYE